MSDRDMYRKMCDELLAALRKAYDDLDRMEDRAVDAERALITQMGERLGTRYESEEAA